MQRCDPEEEKERNIGGKERKKQERKEEKYLQI